MKATPNPRYWDERRTALCFPDEQQLNAYKALKALAIAHKRAIRFRELATEMRAHAENLEIQELYPDQLELNRTMIQAGYEMPSAIRGLHKRLNYNADALLTLTQDRISEIIKHFPDLNWAFEIPIDPSLQSPAALADLFTIISRDKIDAKGLLAMAIDQLKIRTHNQRIQASIKKARRALSSASAETKKEIRAYIKDATGTLIPQATIEWTGIDRAKEIGQTALRASEIFGTGMQDAFMASHKLPNAARSTAQRLLSNFALNTRGAMGEAIASSFAGFPEPEDIIQQGLLKLSIKAANAESQLSWDSALLNRSIRQEWTDMQRAAQTQRRNLAAAMTGPMAPEIARSEAEAWDLLDQMQALEIPALLEKCLTDKQRKAFTLCEIEGYSQRAAADTLGITRPTLQKSLNEAKRKLKAALTA